MKFCNERLTGIRESLGLNKAEAARMLNMSAMGYGRYEKGEREPSFQTVSFIADTFNTTTDYLYGLSDKEKADTITVSASENPELFQIVQILKNNRDITQRVFPYFKKLIDL